MDVSLSGFPDGTYAVVVFHPCEDVSALNTVEDEPVVVFRLRTSRTWTEFESECGHMRYVADCWTVAGGFPTRVTRLAEQWVRVVH